IKGNRMFDRLSGMLNFRFQRKGALVICKSYKNIQKLEEIKENGIKNGVKHLEIIGKSELKEIEPNIHPDIIAALYAPSAGIVCPYGFTIALIENAIDNGVVVMLETEALDIKEIDDYKLIDTSNGKIKAKYIINAAGLQSDSIAEMAGINDFNITPRKGQYYVYDKKYGDLINHTIFPMPSDVSKGIVVTPTVDGNLLVGPNAEEIEDKGDLSTTAEGLKEVLRGAQETLPGLSKEGVINEFSGLRAAYKKTGDFYIKTSRKVGGFINVAGIQSPGLSAAPAIAEYVLNLFKEEIKTLDRKKKFNPVRERPVNFKELSHEEQNKLIDKNEDFGEIICRCENVTKAEVIKAINRSLPAKTIEAVARRTRAGFGRCRGGFCQPKVLKLISQQLNIPPEEVTYSGGNSYILEGKTKQRTMHIAQCTKFECNISEGKQKNKNNLQSNEK
ncbi:MAG: NAD(P)/FAD-dependent oxidoreductase, partial [Candidatus Mcinerneyibacterium aminivorans]